MKDELKQIKKKYGERMMKLCRSLFPTILNEEGKLIEILDSTFEHPKYLYDDIVEKNAIDDFKNFIYSKYKNEQREKNKTDKTPYQLMKEAGYTLYECKSNADIMKFRKWYAIYEVLCTFKWGNRLDTNYVFFAVKDNVDDIKREDFKEPKRQDEYGTSVISIQFSRGDVNTLSIKNRYNHTVDNPDATFDNDLDNIIPGLTDSFEKHYGFNINQNEIARLELNYVRANDGKYYKYNMELNNIYYCPDNIIIKNGEVIKDFMDKEKYLVIDYFILNLQNNNIDPIYNDKSITQYDCFIHDCFQDDLQNFDKININKNEDGIKTIELIKKDKFPVHIKIDKCNNIIGYTNSNLKEVGHYFLKFNRKLNKINIKNVEKIGEEFLYFNEKLQSLKLPKVIYIGRSFMSDSPIIKTLQLDRVKKIEDCFLYWNQTLEYLYAPNLERVRASFLAYNNSLETLSLSKIKRVGDDFLENNKNLNYIDMPNLEEAGDRFMSHNLNLTTVDFPKLEMLKYAFLSNNTSLKNINLPNVTIIGDNCLECADVEEISMPKVEQIGQCFMDGNIHLKNIYMPELIHVGNRFLYRNKNLRNIIFPKLEIIEDNFIVENFDIDNVELPLCRTIGRNFLYKNLNLKKLSLPKTTLIEKNFLTNNDNLEYLYIPNLNLVYVPKDFYDKYGRLSGLLGDRTKKLIR